MMLQNDETDDDFFTPVAGTSLANIFGNRSKHGEEKANDSLKYVPPKPQNIATKPEQTKTTECIFACAILGHEWLNNVYMSRGKLGLAIFKIHKTGEHNIILYDSAKITLSCATVSTKLEVTIKNSTYISYYDNLRKYWSLYGTEEEVKKVSDQLSKLGVDIKYSTYTDTTDEGPPEPVNVNIKTSVTSEKSELIDKDSDTDSSINRKTKASILNRMANMGHSVLPTRTLPVERTSDSSDTMEIETQPKSVRHKPVKNVMKRSNGENLEIHLPESHQRILVPKAEQVGNNPVYTSHSGPVLPITTTNFLTSSNSELGLFMSEQRISNSELRINMNRITDKVDSVLDKINNIEHKGTNVHTNILMKLLAEYENKIKVYEDLMQTRESNMTKNLANSVPCNNEIQKFITKISDMEKISEEKSNEVLSLQKEINLLKLAHTDEKLGQENKEDELRKMICSLENTVKAKDVEFIEMVKKCENLSTNSNCSNDSNIADKVKNIMNDTYQTISLNFDNNVDYSGETVKKIIGAVIKKITIQTLSEL